LVPADQHTWRLSKCGDQNLGLACAEDGLFLGRAPLAERHGRLYTVRPKGHLVRVLSHAYRAEIGADRLLPGLATVASALSKNNLSLAQIAAVHLRLPDLPDAIARAGLEIVRQLYERGLRPGDYYVGTRFDYWPDVGCQAVLDRIKREWIKAGADPNLAEPICWFAPQDR
jgi:hypothetical protein